MNGSDEQFGAELDGIRSRLSRGRLGLLVGAVLGVVVVALVSLAFGSEGASGWDSTVVVTFACFGAALGHVATVGRLTRRAEDVVGLDLAADRIKRTVRGEEHGDLSPEQQRRAARYAAISVLIAPAQALRWTLFFAGILIGQVSRLIRSALDADQPFAALTPAAVGVIGAVVLATVIPPRLRAARQAREYAESHPWQDPPAEPAHDADHP